MQDSFSTVCEVLYSILPWFLFRVIVITLVIRRVDENPGIFSISYCWPDVLAAVSPFVKWKVGREDKNVRGREEIMITSLRKQVEISWWKHGRKVIVGLHNHHTELVCVQTAFPWGKDNLFLYLHGEVSIIIIGLHGPNILTGKLLLCFMTGLQPALCLKSHCPVTWFCWRNFCYFSKDTKNKSILPGFWRANCVCAWKITFLATIYTNKACSLCGSRSQEARAFSIL